MRAIIYADASWYDYREYRNNCSYTDTASGYGAVILFEDGRSFEWSGHSAGEQNANVAELSCIRKCLSLDLLDCVKEVVVFCDNQRCHIAMKYTVQVRGKRFMGVYYPIDSALHKYTHKLSRRYADMLKQLPDDFPCTEVRGVFDEKCWNSLSGRDFKLIIENEVERRA